MRISKEFVLYAILDAHKHAARSSLANKELMVSKSPEVIATSVLHSESRFRH